MPSDGGECYEMNMKVRGKWERITVDNSWVVPYNPLLCRMFDSHINVEYCNSVKSIKYILKYVNKATDGDKGAFNLQSNERNIDEINDFQCGRYISTNEAVCRILRFPIHERYPAVMHLHVHLPNGQRIYFNENNLHERLANPPNTTLTALSMHNLNQNSRFLAIIHIDLLIIYCDLIIIYNFGQII